MHTQKRKVSEKATTTMTTINDLIEANGIEETFAFTAKIKDAELRCMKLGADEYIEKSGNSAPLKVAYSVSGIMSLEDLLIGWQTERFGQPVSESVIKRTGFYSDKVISEVKKIE